MNKNTGYLWRKIKLQVRKTNESKILKSIPNTQQINRSKQDYPITNESISQIKSPTFICSNSYKTINIQDKQSESFSFGQQLLGSIQNIFNQSNKQFKKQLPDNIQQFQIINDNKYQHFIKKNILFSAFNHVGELINHVKIIINFIKINIAKFQEFYLIQKQHLSNYLLLFFNQYSSEFNHKLSEKQQIIHKLSLQNYVYLQKCKQYELKTNSYEKQIFELINTINEQKINSQKLYQKYITIYQQLYQQIKQNLSLINYNHQLQNQINKLIPFKNFYYHHFQNNKQNNFFKFQNLYCQNIINEKSNFKTHQKINKINKQQYFSSRQSYSNHPPNEKPIFSTRIVNNTSNTTQDCFHECAQSIALGQNKTTQKVAQQLNSLISNQQIKPLQNRPSFSPSITIDNYLTTKHSISLKQKQKITNKPKTHSTRIHTQPNSFTENKIKQYDNKNILLKRICKLKNDICQDILSLQIKKCQLF